MTQVVYQMFLIFLMVVWLPLIALVDLLIIVFDGFPVMFSQRRVGRGGIAYADIWKEIIRDPQLSKIILVTQGEANSYTNRESKVLHIKLTNTGRSKAINRGLQEVHTELVGLTDDDCYLHKDWVFQATKILSDPTVGLAFGQTFPYQPEKHKDTICPCTFARHPNKPSVISRVVRHWTDVGFDNNAVIATRVFDEIGGYKWWLGPGSLGKNADDAEFILRALITKHKIAYNPSMIAYHNRWLTSQQWREALRYYLCGGVAAYGFYGFQGVRKCQSVVHSYTRETVHTILHSIREYMHKPISPIPFMKEVFAEAWFLCWGLAVAFVFAKLVPIPARERINAVRHPTVV